MIRINLLPHREMRRERRKKEFVAVAGVVAMAGVVAAFAVGTGINTRIDAQVARNAFLKAENAKLDSQIKEIANLRAEIDGLKARQRAVENLQSDRTMPVHLLDELVRQVPEGIHLKQVKQGDLKVSLAGWAQSNERVSELLRNLAYGTPWLEKPELGEIKAVMLTPAGQPQASAKAGEGRRAYEFALTAQLKRPERADRKVEQAAGAVPPVAAAAPGK